MSQQINLYNPLLLKREKYFSARTMLQALGLIALGLAALYLYALLQTREFERLAKDNRDQLAAQREQFVRIGGKISPRGLDKALENELARLEAEAKARRSVVAALRTGELGNTAGFSGYFAALGRAAMPGVWLTGFSVGESGNDLQVRGRVLHPDLVPAYLRALNGESVMRGRQVTELTLAAKETSAAPRLPGPERFVEFSLAAQLHAAGPAAAPGASPGPKGGGS